MERIPPTGDPAEESPPVPDEELEERASWDNLADEPIELEPAEAVPAEVEDDLLPELEPEPEAEPEMEAAPLPPQILAGGPITIGVPHETDPNERRVGFVPDTVKRLTAQGV